MTLDTGHARTTGYDESDIVLLLRSHGDVVSHIHINDTQKPRDQHFPFGAGNFNFKRIFESLPSDWTDTFALKYLPRSTTTSKSVAGNSLKYYVVSND